MSKFQPVSEAEVEALKAAGKFTQCPTAVAPIVEETSTALKHANGILSLRYAKLGVNPKPWMIRWDLMNEFGSFLTEHGLTEFLIKLQRMMPADVTEIPVVTDEQRTVEDEYAPFHTQVLYPWPEAK